MADQLHNALSQFRDTMLTAVARLEFQIRDTLTPQMHNARVHPSIPAEGLWSDSSTAISEIRPDNCDTINSNVLHGFVERMEALEHHLKNLTVPSMILKNDIHTNVNSKNVNDLLTIQEDKNTKNVLVSNVKLTPALTAAVAALNMPNINIVDGGWMDDKDEVASVPESQVDTEGEVVEEANNDNESDDEEAQLKKIVIKGVQYYMDDNNVVYTETEDGYEQIGTYSAKTDSLILDEAEEAEEEEEEEDAIEVDDFVYKGKTYQRDSEQNVYDDGEQIGTWNGKRIVPLT